MRFEHRPRAVSSTSHAIARTCRAVLATSWLHRQWVWLCNALVRWLPKPEGRGFETRRPLPFLAGICTVSPPDLASVRQIKMTYAGRAVKLLLLGATGGTGRQLLSQALEAGHEVTALARSPEKLNAQEHLLIQRGDATDPQALDGAVAGQDAVLSALGVRSP